MFAARADQENLAYAHQTAAAAKPLNQQAKTPSNKAPKTPFRRNQNDENDAFQSGFKTGKTGKKADSYAFVTPAGPRNRAPLGMKTTNAKAKTPAPVTAKASAQKTSPRLRRSKVKIHQAAPVEQAPEDGVPDIEHMPPRSVALPDYPDKLHEKDWSMLKPEHQTNGYWGAFENAPDADGLRPAERKKREMMVEADKAEQDIIRRALEADQILSLDLSQVRKELEKKHQHHSRAPSSLSSKRAASALSRSSSATSLGPRFAAPTTASARSRVQPVHPVSRKPTSSVSSSTTAPGPSTLRHATATATSRNTLGYARGRAVSATARRPLSALHERKPSTSVEKESRSVLQSLVDDDAELEDMLRERQEASDEKDSVTKPSDALPLNHEEDDEYKDFQLTLSE